MTPKLVPLIVVAAGLAAGIAAGAALGTSASDIAVLAALAGGASTLAGALAGGVLRRLDGRSFATHALVVAGGAVAATASGIGAAAWAMFLSGHDLGVLAVVLIFSTSVAVAAALTTGRRFRTSVEALTEQAESVVAGERDALAADGLVTSELRHLASVLTEAGVDLARARASEERLERSRRELVAWVSHDLRSPIGAIRAMAEALEDGVVSDPADVAAYHRALRQETERLSGFVDDLFELARIEAGAPAAGDVPFVPFSELLTEIVDAATARANTRGVRLLGELEGAGSELVVAADLRRALDNVIDNAIRHTPAGGSVTVTAQAGPTTVLLVVADECGGIPAADLGHLFDVAYRGDQARGRDTGGAGLGLAIAKGLVEARAGAISVRNAGRGCEFTVQLPAES